MFFVIVRQSFWLISNKFFWFTAIESGIYKFASVHPSVRHSEISESVHRNFLKFGTKLGLPNATEVTFSDFARKILFGPFGLFSQIVDISCNFLERIHRIFLILHI